jgi:hypothetical protein
LKIRENPSSKDQQDSKPGMKNPEITKKIVYWLRNLLVGPIVDYLITAQQKPRKEKEKK